MSHIYNSQLDAYTLYHKQQEHHPSFKLSGPALPALGHAIAGSTGTAVSNLAIYPLDLIITRLQVQRQLRKTVGQAEEGEYLGVFDAAQKIYTQEGGIAAFYAGLLQDTGKSIADSFLFFLFYNYLRQNRLQKHGASTTTLPVLDELGVGALAGACSKFFTTPLANIVTRKQTAHMSSSRSSSAHTELTVSEIASQIRHEKGIQGFWSGYSASLVLTLNPSLTFFLYETFKRTLLPRAKRDDPGVRITFLMAAVSKAIASTVTYPFSLAKARSQAGSKQPVETKDIKAVEGDVSALEKVDGENLDEKRAQGRKMGKDLKAVTKRSTVFSTILDIYRTEGPAALYEGVLGEICKGFFSHGMTMLVKESVHKFIIQLYFLVLKTLTKFPEKVEEVASEVKEKAEKVYSGTKDQAGILVERAQVIGSNATEAAKSGAESVNEAVGEVHEGAKQTTTDLLEKTRISGSNATKAAEAGVEYLKAQTSSKLELAREAVGKSMEQTGRSIQAGTAKGEDK